MSDDKLQLVRFKIEELQGLGQAPPPPQPLNVTFVQPELSVTSLVFGLVDMASSGLSAYHGYKRNNSVGWAVGWGILGGLFPVVTPAIAFAQGFGEPIKAANPLDEKETKEVRALAARNKKQSRAPGIRSSDSWALSGRAGGMNFIADMYGTEKKRKSKTKKR